MSKVNRFPKRHWVLFLLCLPSNIVGWFGLFILWLFTGDKIYWNNGLWITIGHKSWFGKLIKNINGGCACHGGWYKTELINGKSINTALEYHEHIHVEQFEAINVYTVLLFMVYTLFSLHFVFLFKWIFVLLIFWSLCWWVFVGCTMLVAWLRGEDPYRGNILEESAYTQDDYYEEDI